MNRDCKGNYTEGVEGECTCFDKKTGLSPRMAYLKIQRKLLEFDQVCLRMQEARELYGQASTPEVELLGEYERLSGELKYLLSMGEALNWFYADLNHDNKIELSSAFNIQLALKKACLDEVSSGELLTAYRELDELVSDPIFIRFFTFEDK